MDTIRGHAKCQSFFAVIHDDASLFSRKLGWNEDEKTDHWVCHDPIKYFKRKKLERNHQGWRPALYQVADKHVSPRRSSCFIVGTNAHDYLTKSRQVPMFVFSSFYDPTFFLCIVAGHSFDIIPFPGWIIHNTHTLQWREGTIYGYRWWWQAR